MRKTIYLLSGIICAAVTAPPSYANWYDYDVDVTAYPAQFGPSGSFIKLTLEATPAFTGQPTYGANKFSTFTDHDGFELGSHGCTFYAGGKLTCECAYRVNPENVSDGQIMISASVDETIDNEEVSGTGTTFVSHDPLVTPYTPPPNMEICYNRRPEVDVGPDLYLIDGSSYQLNPIVSDFEGDTLSYMWSSGPTPQNVKNATILANFNTASISLKVDDGYGFSRHRPGINRWGEDLLQIVTTRESGCAPPSSALMPSTSSPGNFTFTIPAHQVCPSIFWIDPPVATGYDYSVSGAEFLEVKMPDLSLVDDPDGYTLTYAGGAPLSLAPGQNYVFPSPVAQFSLTGIDPVLELDPDNPQAFAIGVDVTNPAVGATHVEINQAVITENYPPLPAQCPPFETADFRNILPVTTHSVNGNYTRTLNRTKMETMMADFLNDARATHPTLAKVEAEFKLEDYGPGSFPAGYVGPVAGMDRLMVSYDGSDLTLYDPSNANATLDEFWTEKNLNVDRWYALSVRSFKDGNGSSCGTNFYQFRLPSVTGGRPSFKRPVEIFEAAQISRYNVTLAAVKATGLTVRAGEPSVVSVGGNTSTVGSTTFEYSTIKPPAIGTATISQSPVVITPTKRLPDIKPIPQKPVTKELPKTEVETKKVRKVTPRFIPKNR